MCNQIYFTTAFMHCNLCGYMAGNTSDIYNLTFFYLLGKGGYVFGSIDLFVCWTTLLKKTMNALGWNFMEGSVVVQQRTD